MAKTTKILIAGLFVGCFLLANQVSAAGLIPCGGTDEPPCTICHFFQMIDTLIDFVLFNLAPPIAILMLIVGGGMFMLSTGDPQKITIAKKIISSVLIGIVIIYGAYFIIGLFLQSIGLAEWTDKFYKSWWEGAFTIPCNGEESAPDAFSPPIESTAVLIEIPINKNFSNDGNLFTFQTKPIYSMSATGKITLNKSDGYARIILTDVQGKEYLVYEAAGPLDSGSFSFENDCQETCVLNGVMPKSVDVELSSATLNVTKLSTLEDKQDLKTEVHTMGMEPYREKRDKDQKQIKINKINQYIEENDLQWTAGETSVSGLSYAEKKGILGGCGEIPDKLPNLQGFEYYKGGIFKTIDAKGITPAPSDFPEYFDWRNRHGENWLTPIRDQGRCGSCWAFGATAAVEAIINLYYNQHLDIDLSEQDILSCMYDPLKELGGGGCNGGWPDTALDYYNVHGVVLEECFPYQAKDMACDKCSGIKSRAVIKTGEPEISGWADIEEKDLKRKIIERGPLSAGIPSIGHAMALVGWETNPSNNNTIWIFKNSWGDWYGDKGYAKIEMPSTGIKHISAVGVPITIADYQPSIMKCVDKDGDGYCNWGISKNKPSNCPSRCGKEKDCNDSNSKLGPFDSNFNCQVIEPSPEKLIDCEQKYGQDYWCSSHEGWEAECRGWGEEIHLGDYGYCRSNNTTYYFCVTCKEEESADCRPNHTDSYDGKCEQDCNASSECDEKAPNSAWISDNICHWCNSVCKYSHDSNKPSAYFLSKDNCYYNCLIGCGTSGWRRTVDCNSEYCPKFRVSNNQCDYEREGCTAKGCEYSKSVPEPCAGAVCTENGWDKSACASPLSSCYIKSESGSAQWLKCNSGDVMVGWYHWTNNWGNDEIKIKCCSLNRASLGSCSTDKKEGGEQLMDCGSGYVCTGKYHQTNNWGDDELKTKCCELQNASLGSCYVRKESGSKQWIECNSGEVITEWYHWTNNWGNDDIRIKCCSIE